jgi:hypothetical protein
VISWFSFYLPFTKALPSSFPLSLSLTKMRGFSSLFSLASLLALVTASNVLDLTPENFDKEILKSGKPALVEFFAVSSFFFPH